MAIQLTWAFGMGLGLNRVAASWAAYALALVCLLTAVMAIAYHGERNPILRASHPIGNPLFLAACLIPGILVAVGAAVTSFVLLLRKRAVMFVLPIAGCLGAAAVMLYAFYLTGSRGPLLGLLVGAGFFAERLFRLGILTLVWTLTRRYSIGLLVSAVLFGLYHVTPLSGMAVYLATPLPAVITSAAMGIYMGLVYRYRGFAAAVLVHGLGDWIVIMMITSIKG